MSSQSDDLNANPASVIAALRAERDAALAREAALTKVLDLINQHPESPQPAFDAILEAAVRLSGSGFGVLASYDGHLVRSIARYGLEPAGAVFTVDSGTLTHRIVLGEDIVTLADVRDDDAYRAGVPSRVAIVDRLGARTQLIAGLRKDGRLLGFINIFRREVRPFSETELGVVKAFAAQAVIAMENARLLTEQREALEQQTATAEILRVINANPGDVAPVFDSILEKSLRLGESAFGSLWIYDGDRMYAAASRGLPPALAEWRAENPVQQPANSSLEAGRTKRSVQTLDVRDAENYRAGRPGTRAVADLGGARTMLVVPLTKNRTMLGGIQIYRQEIRAFSGKQIALLESFAAQAVIAMENARLIAEQREALEQQTATTEVLGVINANPGNLAPVFQTILDKAMRLCGAAFGSFYIYDGERAHVAAHRGVPAAYIEHRANNPPLPRPGSSFATIWASRRPIQILDSKTMDNYETGETAARAMVDLGGIRTLLTVPLVKDETVLGFVQVYRQEVRAFTDKEIALLENFAAQAVIAMENARLMAEQQEALEQQTATAEVLRVINASPGYLTPVFDVILAKAHALCGADLGALGLFENGLFRKVARYGYKGFSDEALSKPYPPQPVHAPFFRGEPVHIPDVLNYDWPTHEWGEDITATSRAYFESSGLRTWLEVPLWKDGTLLGTISGWRREPRPFSDNEIRLLESFAAQAVIAMENARLLNEVRQRQEELRITFENMGDGVALFDATPRLVAWNRKFQEILDVPDEVFAERKTYEEYIRYLTARGEFGPDADPEVQIRRLTGWGGQPTVFERTRPNGRTIEVHYNPVPTGGFVLIYADITERKQNEQALRAARDASDAALRELKTAQANLIQAEKMASLGQLTAGIAHEIKNPLNFVNNFADLSVELLAELKETAAPGFAALDENARADIDDLSATLTSNLGKIVEHGRRADGIVRAMLEHSRGASGERRTVNLNNLAEEALNLAYHGARAQDQSFNITLERAFDSNIPPIELNPQDITRVLLNLFSNGFYAARKRQQAEPGHDPVLKVSTRDLGDAVEIVVRDNGTGIPAEIKDKLFEPFFTTKPTGEGTGLGLSISYDVVTKQHGGTIAVDSEPDAYTAFTVTLPRRNT